MFVQVHRSAAGVLWRFRTEAAACSPAAAGIWELDQAVAAAWTVVILTVSAVLVTVLPLDPAAGHPAGVLHAVPSPHPPGLLRDPDAHPIRAAPAGAAHLPHRGRGTRGHLVPGRDLRRGFRSCTRPRSPLLVMPARPGSRATGGGRRSSSWTSCAATPSPRTTSSPPAWSQAVLTGGNHPPRDPGSGHALAAGRSQAIRTKSPVRKEVLACLPTSNPCSRSARCPGTAKEPSSADYPGDWDEARMLAGLDWDPVSTDVYAVTGINPDGTEHYEPVTGGRQSAGPTPAPSCRSTRTPTR